MTRLTDEDKDALRALLDSDTWKSVEKFVGMGVERMRDAVISAPIDDIIAARQRLDGATRLANMVLGLKKELKDGDAKRSR